MSRTMLSLVVVAVGLEISTVGAQNCWHIINARTGQYLQSTATVDPNHNYYKFAWLSHDRSNTSLWSIGQDPESEGEQYIQNRVTKEFLILHHRNSTAYLMTKEQAAPFPRKSFLFRMDEKNRPCEIVNLWNNQSLYAESPCAGDNGIVKGHQRCGLEQCRWRFEGYTC